MVAIVETTTNFKIFWELSGFLIVVGLTFTTTFMSYEPRYVVLALKATVRIVYAPRFSRNFLKAEVGRIIRWAYTLQKSGIPGFESESKKVASTDKFLRYGVEMVVSGHTGEHVRHIMTTLAETMFQRNTVPADILRAMAANAPTFGMLATVIGLIMMLASMGSDPKGLGAAMGVAMSGTLYGVALARLILMPAAAKLQQREEIVRFRNYLVTEGLVMLADHKSPRLIQDMMNSFLDPAIHFNIDKMKSQLAVAA